MIIEEIMSKKVCSLGESNTVDDAIEIFKNHNYKSIPIVDEGHRFKGIVNLRNLISIKEKDHPIVDFIDDKGSSICVNNTEQSLFNHFINKSSNSSLYVTNDNHQLLGIITKKDLLNYLIDKRYFSSSADSSEKTLFDLFKNNNTVEAFNNMSEGVVVIDTDTKIVFANKTYTKMVGISYNKVINRYLSKVEPRARILDVLKTGKPIHNEEIFVESVGIIVLANITPIINKDQEIIGAISSFSNKTEIINMANQLKEAEKKSKLYEAELKKNRNLPTAFDNIIGNSESMREVLEISSRIAKYDVSILITGENGTGKELLAKSIHDISKRKNKPFVKINCSAIPENLIESELFGYEEGAFTGAKKGGKKGKIELAQGGTLFLDEIGDMPLFMQPKLLRFLQDGELEKVGSEKSLKVDVRVITATNRSLPELISNNLFREDLYYRINTFSLKIPPLRIRKIDILSLIKYYGEFYNKLHKKNIEFSSNAIEVLLKYNWPGNIRELKNIIERCVLMADTRVIEPNNLDIEITNLVDSTSSLNYDNEEEHITNMNHAIRKLEERMLRQALIMSKNKSDAMGILGISRRTFYKKMKEYNISV
jgi:transcriptional regulator with PAS, ATPase and Fis domain